MVLRGLRKPLTLIGPVVLAAAALAACTVSDSDDCSVSGTCPGQAGEAGSGAEGGDGQGTGGSSGSSAGTPGAAGMDDGGRGGTGGVGDAGEAGVGGGGDAGAGGEGVDIEPPTLEAFAPDDGSVDVERDIEMTAELSEAVDEATVTEASVRLAGPEGEVAGTASVDENVISFVPDRPLYLLGTYTFTLDETIADLAGNKLEASASAEFQVRDGRFSEPTYPFGESERRELTGFRGNALGDAFVGTESLPNYENIVTGLYHAAENRWTTALVPDASGSVSSLGIDSQRRAVLSWTAYPIFDWARYDQATGFTPIAGPSAAPRIIVTPEGQALAITWDETALRYVSRVLNLSTGDLGPGEELPLGSDANLAPVTSGERFAVVNLRPIMDGEELQGEELAITWKGSTGWGANEPLAFAADIGGYSCDSDEEGNIIVVWDEAGAVRSRVYEPSQNAWTAPVPVMTRTPPVLMGAVVMTAGRAIVTVQKFAPDSAGWAAIYETGGWDEDAIVLLDEPLIGSVAPTIDSRGNALVVWGDDLTARRYVAGSGWSEASPLDLRVYLFNRWAVGAPDGSVIVANMDVDQLDQPRVPVFVRFE